MKAAMNDPEGEPVIYRLRAVWNRIPPDGISPYWSWIPHDEDDEDFDTESDARKFAMTNIVNILSARRDKEGWVQEIHLYKEVQAKSHLVETLYTRKTTPPDVKVALVLGGLWWLVVVPALILWAIHYLTN